MKASLLEEIPVIPNKYFTELAGLVELGSTKDETEIIISKWVSPDATELANYKNLKYYITLSIGYNTVAVDYLSTHDVRLINCPGHNSNAVAEHGLSLMFALSRRLKEIDRGLSSGLWRNDVYDYQSFELGGRTLGIVGYGTIGKRLGELAKGLGMKIIWVNSQSTREEFTDLLQTSDFVALTLPLTDATKLMISSKELSLMKESAFLINISRGAIVDTSALLNALRNNTIKGAGLDTVDGEPIIGQNTDNINELHALNNVIITPHVAFNTIEAGENLGIAMINNVKAILAGQPTNVVN
jgi:glyoxylate reductase